MWHASRLSIGIAVLDTNTLPRDPVVLLKAALKSLVARPGERARSHPGGQHAHGRYAPHPLRLGGERRGEEAASKRTDEGSSVHKNPRMTADLGGTWRPAGRIYHQPARSGRSST